MGVAAEEKTTRTQGELEVTVIHVDKLGVYVPEMVFYWDGSLNKQKLAALTATAEKLRNRRATIIYSAMGSPTQDKRPLIVDIVPYKEQSYHPPAYGVISPEQSGSTGYTEAIDGRSARSNDAFSSDPFPERDIPEPKSFQDDASHEETAPKTVDGLDQPAQASGRTLPIQKRDVLMLVEHLLHLTERKSLDSILYYYADSVNYYARGNVGRDYIRRDLGYYFKNWDTIRCALEGDVQVLDNPRPDVKTVRFLSTYSVENTKKSVSGKTENTWMVQRTHTGLKVIDQKQTVIHSSAAENP
jgi:hypothetical protein